MKILERLEAAFGRLSFNTRIKTSDIVLFTRELSTLSGAGISLTKALVSQRDQLREGKFRYVLTQVIDGVERGESFSESLSRFPNAFPRIYVNMIKSGEVSGTLDEMLKRLATLLEKQQKLKKKVAAALIYPAFVLGMAFLILSLLMIFVIPTFTEMFAEMGSDLPGPTLFLIALSNAFKNYWYAILAGVFVCLYGWHWLMRIPQAKYVVDALLLKLPLVGNLLTRVVIARMARTLGTLLNSNISILTALSIVRETTGNLVFANCIPGVSDSVKEGESLARMMEETTHFPNLVIKMVGVGEETGQMAEMLIRVADTYEEDVDVLISSLSSLMEPFLIVVMGVIVGFIVIAMFLPLFNLTEMI